MNFLEALKLYNIKRDKGLDPYMRCESYKNRLLKVYDLYNTDGKNESCEGLKFYDDQNDEIVKITNDQILSSWSIISIKEDDDDDDWYEGNKSIFKGISIREAFSLWEKKIAPDMKDDDKSIFKGISIQEAISLLDEKKASAIRPLNNFVEYGEDAWLVDFNLLMFEKSEKCPIEETNIFEFFKLNNTRFTFEFCKSDNTRFTNDFKLKKEHIIGKWEAKMANITIKL